MKNKVPKLRFPEFSGEWEEKKLGGIFEHRSERGFENLELLSVTMRDGVKKRTDIEGKDNSSEDKSNYKRVYKQDIVYNSMRMWQGASGISLYDGIVSPAYTVLKGNEFNSSIYFGYFFKTTKMINIFQRNSQGLTSDTWNLKYPQLSLIKITCPSLAEQEKIANFLSSVDTKIAKLEKKKELLDKYKKGMVQKLFSQKLRFKDENGNNYPEWGEKKLGEIAKFSKGKNIAKTDISEEGFECIRYGELYTKYNEVIKGISSKTNLKETELVFSEKGDIIIPASGETAIDLATASCVLKNGVALGGDINIIKTKESGIFLSYYMNSSKKYEIASLAQGISVIHIYNSQLGLLKLSLPSLLEQEKIANFLYSVDTKIELIEKELEKNREFKKGLLQQMFI